MIQPVLNDPAPLAHILGLHREDISQVSMTIQGGYPSLGIETCGPFYMQLRMRCLCAAYANDEKLSKVQHIQASSRLER
jgi:hypothetical protein